MGAAGAPGSGGVMGAAGAPGAGGAGSMPSCQGVADGDKCSDRGASCSSADGETCVCGNNRKWSCVSSSSSGGTTVCPADPAGAACASGICAGNGLHLCLCVLGSWQCLLNE
jgi:hypothetical protein